MSETSAYRLWTHEETARFLRIPVSTLYALNARRAGPKSIKIGRLRRYNPADVHAWIETKAAA